jgi:hypothetical protein
VFWELPAYFPLQSPQRVGGLMLLVCDKYKESMESEVAQCRHPNDYCQSRESCMVWFVEKERKREVGLETKKAGKG